MKLHDHSPAAEAAEVPAQPARVARPGLFARFEMALLGFVVGMTATVLGIAAYNEVRGLHQVGVFARLFEQRTFDRVAVLMDQHVDRALTAMHDGGALPFSEHLAFDYLGTAYDHHMEYAYWLLQQGQMERFNQLREATGFVMFDLSDRDLSGHDLTGVNLTGVDLTRAKLVGCNLSDANLYLTEAPDADLTGANLSNANLYQANLAGATLNEVYGTGTELSEAILANASMMNITKLTGAKMIRTNLASATLFGSSFDGAVLDFADMTITSALETDLSNVASMAVVELTGANLAQARLNPDVMRRAWLVNTQGLTPELLARLRANGGITRTEELLTKVDRRIIDGFTVRIGEDDQVLPEHRRPTLLAMLKDYYRQ